MCNVKCDIMYDEMHNLMCTVMCDVNGNVRANVNAFACVVYVMYCKCNVNVMTMQCTGRVM